MVQILAPKCFQIGPIIQILNLTQIFSKHEHLKMKNVIQIGSFKLRRIL
jgi:hypothetical protein